MVTGCQAPPQGRIHCPSCRESCQQQPSAVRPLGNALAQGHLLPRPVTSMVDGYRRIRAKLLESKKETRRHQIWLLGPCLPCLSQPTLAFSPSTGVHLQCAPHKQPHDNCLRDRILECSLRRAHACILRCARITVLSLSEFHVSLTHPICQTTRSGDFFLW